MEWTGGAFTSNAVVPRTSFKVTSGERISDTLATTTEIIKLKHTSCLREACVVGCNWRFRQDQ
ncbi:hypothetical protein DH86_00001191 [Scytalidium sp. 3C]|nr:hypothetical protein DH86_00001191 [Scytalidium sp. 3C]